MNTNPNVVKEQPIITDPNVDKLSETTNEDDSIKTELSDNETSNENTPESVSTDMTPSNYTENFENLSNNTSQESTPEKLDDTPTTEPKPMINDVVEAPTETPPITVSLPVKTDNLKMISKTQKQYDMIMNQASNVRRQFTKKRKTMSTWDHNKKHEWRNKISDALISVIRQSKNKNTLKHHHGKLKSMRNLFNHYLNSLSSSNQSKKSRTEKKSKK
jgi:hypothetical protein